MKATISIRKEQFGKDGDFQHKWYCVDAEGKTLGRIAAEIAKILQGKHKPIYTPHVDTGDYVVVINAEKVRLTGNKWNDKIYYRHTGYPGGLKSTNAKTLAEKNPVALVSNAVKGMMPKNKLNRQSLRKLKVYAGPTHPHQNHQPETLDL